MKNRDFTDAQLDGLTDEEREGLLDETLVDDPEDLEKAEEGDDDDGKGAGTNEGQGDDGDDDEGNGDDDDDDQGNGDDDGKAAAEEAAAAAAAAAAEQQATQDAAGEDEIKLDDRPVAWLQLGELEKKAGEFNDSLKELAVKFDEGELTAGEYHDQRAAIEAERRAVDTEVMRAQIRKSDAIDTWKQETVPAFFKEHAVYAEKGTVLNQMLDAEVRKIQSTAANPTDPKVLQLAHQRIQSQISKLTGAKPAPADNPKPGKKTSGPKPEMPPTLGGLPASDITGSDDGTVDAHLDRLAVKDRLAYEDALAKLTPAQLDAYLSR